MQTTPITQPLKRGDIREDGYIFVKTMKHANGATYQCWMSPLAYKVQLQRVKKWKAANAEKVAAYRKLWKAANPEKVKEQQTRWRKKKIEAKKA